MGIRKPLQGFSAPSDIQTSVANRAPAQEDQDPFLQGAIEVPDQQTEADLQSVRKEEESLAREQVISQRAQALETLLTGAAGGIGAEVGARALGGGLGGRLLGAPALGAVAAIGASYLLSDPVRSAFGLQPKTKGQKDLAAEDAAVDEILSQGLGAGVKALTYMGGRLIQSAANNSEYARAKSLVDIEQGLSAMKRGASARMTGQEVKESVLGILKQREQQRAQAISSVMSSASAMEAQRGLSSARQLMQGLRETIEREGGVFVDDVFTGINPQRATAKGKAVYPFGDDKEGTSVLSRLVEDYEFLRSKNNGNAIPISVIDNMRNAYVQSSNIGIKEYSGAIRSMFDRLQGMAAKDRDENFVRLLSGTAQEGSALRAYSSFTDEIDTLKNAQSLLASSDMADMIIRDTGSKQKANIVADVVKVFGADSEAANGLRNAFLVDALTPDPVVGFPNPSKILKKVAEAEGSLATLFSRSDILKMRKTALLAKRLNAKNFAGSAGSDEFTSAMADVFAATTGGVSQKARVAYDMLKSNKLVLDQFGEKLLAKARSKPARTGEEIEEIAKAIGDFLAFSSEEVSKSGIIKLVPGPVLTRLFEKEAMQRRQQVNYQTAPTEEETKIKEEESPMPQEVFEE